MLRLLVKAIVFAGCLALLGTLLGTKLAIVILVKKGYGQLIRDDGPTSHHVARNSDHGWPGHHFRRLDRLIGSHLITFSAPSASALLVLFLFTGLGGRVSDDYVKISKQRSLGLRRRPRSPVSRSWQFCLRSDHCSSPTSGALPRPHRPSRSSGHRMAATC